MHLFVRRSAKRATPMLVTTLLVVRARHVAGGTQIADDSCAAWPNRCHNPTAEQWMAGRTPHAPAGRQVFARLAWRAFPRE